MKHKVERFEVIDHRLPVGITGVSTGRVYSASKCEVELSHQDNGLTLKIFIDGQRPPERPSPACTCGSDNPKSARFGHPHIIWCEKKDQLMTDLFAACKALLDAPHPDHFASRLGDEELDALNRIKAILKAS